ncbi:MAG: hypothetical protein ACRD16_00915 [Thermoanaerobaculia bacterium]
MRATSIGMAGTLLLLGLRAAGASPVTKAQLMSMAKEGVDPKVILAIVERDCVDFDVDAGNAGALSRAVPAPVLEAAISCRRAAFRAPKSGTDALAPAGAAASAAPLSAPRAAEAGPSPAASSGTLRLRAEFIGESDELTCSCLLDGAPLATLTKPAEGEFGQAVPRNKIGKETADLAVPAGRHRLVFQCDPRGQQVPVDVDIPAGQRRTVEIRESTLRRWKLRSVR